MFLTKALQPESNAQFLLCVAISAWSVFACACPTQVLLGRSLVMDSSALSVSLFNLRECLP